MTLESDDRELYARHREHLVDSRRLAYEQFDKAVFLLAGGGLTISLTLVEQIIPFATAGYKSALIAAWGGFTLSILSTLYSFIVSQKALDNELQKIDGFLKDGDDSSLTQRNRAADWTQRLNKTAFMFIVVAIISLVIFVSFNLS